jgi:hypothetical protein
MTYPNYPPNYDPNYQPNYGNDGGGGKATASLVLGILGLFGWCIPIIGLPMTITGLVLGVKSLKSQSRGTALAGVILCTIGLIFSLINAATGAYLAATGRNPFVNKFLH